MATADLTAAQALQLPTGATRAALPGAPAPKLSGPAKAAVLMVTLGEEKASEVFKHLSQTEAETLSLEIAKSGRVPSDVCKAVISEAIENVMAEEFVAEGGVDYARSLLEKSLGPERAQEIIGRLAATIERRPFEFLRRTPPEQINVFLRNESPQTIALVVANLHDTLAAQVIMELSPEEQADVARRVARMGETAPEVVEAIERVMKQKLSNVVAQEFAAVGGVKSLADILNNADRSTERNVLDELARVDMELAEEIRVLLFTFEDIVKLDDRSIQMILKDVDQKDLAIALRGVAEDVKARIFANMSERGAELLREEIEFQPPQRRRVIEEAQGRIVAAVRRLEEAGAVVISRGGGAGGDDELM